MAHMSTKKIYTTYNCSMILEHKSAKIRVVDRWALFLNWCFTKRQSEDFVGLFCNSHHVQSDFWHMAHMSTKTNYTDYNNLMILEHKSAKIRVVDGWAPFVKWCLVQCQSEDCSCTEV